MLSSRKRFHAAAARRRWQTKISLACVSRCASRTVTKYQTIGRSVHYPQLVTAFHSDIMARVAFFHYSRRRTSLVTHSLSHPLTTSKNIIMQPGPDYFLVRPGTDDGKPGTIVPLIAVDQLPDWMQLASVPRELNPEQTTGLTNLGVVDKGGDGVYEVRLHHDKIRAILSGREKMTSGSSPDREGKAKPSNNKSSSPQAEQDDKDSELGNISLLSLDPVHEEPAAEPQDQNPPHPAERMLGTLRHNIIDTTARGGKPIRPHMTQAMRDKPHPAAVQRGSGNGSGSITKDRLPQATNGNHDSVFCRHWCHYGTCKWGRGCRFQHRMPTTSEGLREVGLKDFPTWYLLVMGGGGFHDMTAASPGSGLDSLFGGLGGVWNRPGATTLSPPSQCLPTTTSAAAAARAASHPHPSAPAPHRQPPATQHHPSPTDLLLVQGRMSGLLASPNAMSNRQKLRQVKEMRDILMRGSRTHASAHAHAHAHANLHTNASVAANAAKLRQQAGRRIQQEYVSDLPAAMRAAVGVGVGDDVDDEVRPEDSVSRGRRDSVDACVEGERQSLVGSEDGYGHGHGLGHRDGQRSPRTAAPGPEEKLVDID